MSSSQRPRIILDTDPGLDDAFAFAVAERYTDVVGITAVAGNVSLDNTGRNALAIAGLFDMDATVHFGADRPLVATPLFAAQVHGKSGLGRVELPQPTRTQASNDAAGFIVDATRNEEGIHIVAIGPLTNVAHALRADPAIVDRVASITLMGGSATFGNVTAAAEFNIYADPEAAAEVFASGAPITMAGLNLTHQVLMGSAHLDQLRQADTVASRFLADIGDSRMDFFDGALGLDEAPLHDPCAVLAVARPELFEGVRRHVAVEAAGEFTRGMTLVDEREPANPSAANATVLYGVDSSTVLDLILAASIAPS